MLKDYPRESAIIAMKWGPWIVPGAKPPPFAKPDYSPGACRQASTFRPNSPKAKESGLFIVMNPHSRVIDGVHTASYPNFWVDLAINQVAGVQEES